MSRSPVRAGFTLVEVVVSIAVIGVLAALLLPAVQRSREAARRAQCQNNLRQIGIALHAYHATYRVFPPGWINPMGWSWSTQILPELDQAALFGALQVTDGTMQPPDSGTELDVPLAAFVCPSDLGPERNPFYSSDFVTGYHKSNYPAVNGDGNSIQQIPGLLTGTFGANSRIGLKNLLDGSSSTAIVGERRLTDLYRGAIWMRSTNQFGTFIMSSAAVGTIGSTVTINSYDARIIGFGSAHPGGGHFLFGDGAVTFVSDAIDPYVGRRIANRNDGQPTGL